MYGETYNDHAHVSVVPGGSIVQDLEDLYQEHTRAHYTVNNFIHMLVIARSSFFKVWRMIVLPERTSYYTTCLEQSAQYYAIAQPAYRPS